jgi:hypothetical protein
MLAGSRNLLSLDMGSVKLVRELDKRNIYIKKELKTYNKTIWEKLK